MLEHLPLIVFLVTFVLIFVLRMPIPAGMIAACTLYFLTDGLIKGVGFGALITGAGGSLHLVAQKTIEAIFTNGTIVAVPLFIFAANVMNAGKITEYVFGTCMGLVGRFRGGLAHVNVLASLVFSGMTGSAIADASGLGKLEIDAMRKEGYDDGFSCAITAASATIGPIFPPSIPMVVYAMLTGASVGALFMAGMVPGVLLAVALCVYVYFVAKKRNYPRTAPPKLRDYLLYLTKSIWAMLTPVILLVGIYTGIMTPTEAAAIAAFYGLIVGLFLYKEMDFKCLINSCIESCETSAVIIVLMAMATLFGNIMTIEDVPGTVARAILSFSENKIVILMLINVLLLIVGTFMEALAAIVILVPILLPIVTGVGVSPLHFGVIIVVNLAIGFITPPVGVNLFVASGVAKAKLENIASQALPMIALMLIVLLICTYIPEVPLILVGGPH